MTSRNRTIRRAGGAAIVAVLAAIAANRTVAIAAESAAGAYVLGLRGSGAGITPPEGLFLSNQIYMYRGSISGNLRLEGGSLAANARIAPIVNIPTLLWVTPVDLGGARLGVSLTVPFGNVDVKGQVGPINLKDRIFTFADPSVTAFLGGRHENFHWQIGATAFLPIGDYRKGALANIAKHRGALDLFGALTWFDPQSGIDVTNIVGVTFNRQNEATRYRTGNEFHWEWSVSKKFDNGISIGAVGYHYQQLTGDSGAGAVLGPFKGRATAVGASLGYDFKAGQIPISMRLRYYHEVDAKNRLKGNAAFLSLSMPLWVPGAR